MAIWTTEDVTTITTYLDGLTITSHDDWNAAWPGGDEAAIQVADIDLRGAIIKLDNDISVDGSEYFVNITYKDSETADEETGELNFTSAEINKTWPIATE